MSSLLLMLIMLICRINKAFFASTLKQGSRLFGSSISPKYTSSEGSIIEVFTRKNFDYKGDLLVVPLATSKTKNKDDRLQELRKSIPNVASEIRNVIEGLIDEDNIKIDEGTHRVVRLGKADIKYIALVGIGEKLARVGDVEETVSSAVKFGKKIVDLAKETNSAKVGIALPLAHTKHAIFQVIVGAYDGLYDDKRFKKVPENRLDSSKLKSVEFLGCNDEVVSSLNAAKQSADVINSGVKFAKDLVGAPANFKTPLVIAELARSIASEHDLECKILQKEECEELNMGGYLGVQQGSKFPPQFVHLTYKSKEVDGELVKIALVGKGLTFDSGGYNLKVGATSQIELMKFDMGGCAAVLGCAKAIGQLKPKNVEVHFISAVCENMISSEAMRPGDILFASNGKSMEVINTDAEGRLTLSDALVYAERLKVDKIIDLATLTGACVVGLGEKMAGLYSNNDQLRQEIELAAKQTDDSVWSMPLEPAYKEHIKSKIADIKNVGAHGGGSITAALFLQEFIENTKWAHIDMAGPVWDSKANKPTGWGVKLLTNFILNTKK